MKKTLLFLIIIFFSSYLKAQVKNFMPLEIGNEYQFYDGYDYIFSEIKRDTIYNNGIRYFSFPIGEFGDLRVDSLGNLWSGSKPFFPPPSEPEEYLIFKVDAKIGESWPIVWDFNPVLDTGYGKLIFNDTLIVFGEPRLVKGVRIYDDVAPIIWFWLAEGIGLITHEYDDGSVAVINYAKISGQIYGEYVPVSVEDENLIPKSFSVSQNYPNPFNPSTNIEINIPNNSSQNVKLLVSDILGRKILEEEYFISGSKIIQFNASKYSLTSGVYFYSVIYSNQIITKKFNLLK